MPIDNNKPSIRGFGRICEMSTIRAPRQTIYANGAEWALPSPVQTHELLITIFPDLDDMSPIGTLAAEYSLWSTPDEYKTNEDQDDAVHSAAAGNVGMPRVLVIVPRATT
jgi:hypothetical protein